MKNVKGNKVVSKVTKAKTIKEVAVYDKATVLFDSIRELLNLPTTITQKKKKFKISIVAENHKIGELSLKRLNTNELQILKTSGIFLVKSVAKAIRIQLKKIRKEIRAEKKAEKQALKAEAKNKVTEKKVAKTKVVNEKNVRKEKQQKRNK